MARKIDCAIMDTTTVHGLLLFVGCALEITISSNMATSCRQERDALVRFRCCGFCCRLRVRDLPPLPGGANDSRRPPAEQQYQNWSTFLPQSLPPEQRRKREAPGRPSGTGRARAGKSIRWSRSFAKESD